MPIQSTRLSVLALSLSLAFAATAQAQPASAPSLSRDQAVTQLSAASGGTAQVSLHTATGTARFVRLARPAVMASALRSAAAGDEARQAVGKSDSLQFLSSYGAVFGVRNAATELAAGTAFQDQQGGLHITHAQIYQGLPVFGAEIKIHFNPAGAITAANGTFVPDIAIDVRPTVAAATAALTASAAVQKELGRSASLSTRTPRLMVYREGLVRGVPGANHLAWQVEVGNGRDVRMFVYVDAQNGSTIDTFSGIHTDLNRRAYDGANQTTPGPNYPNNPSWVEGQPFPTGITEADNMILAAQDAYKLFKNAFGRDSFDGKGARMDMVYNRGDLCPNASWNGRLISFCPGFTTDDITAHEWGHAYTDYTDDLIYAWQPGALNEAYSDIWGETVDRLNGRGMDTPNAPRTADACTFQTSVGQVVVNQPAAIAGVKLSGTAAFGAQTFVVNSTEVVVVNDGVGTTTDACETPFVNAAALTGKIAYIDRGTCGYSTKTKRAEDAGAIAVIIGNNQAGIATMGSSGENVTIPALSISQADGAALKAQAQTGSVRLSMRRGLGTDNSVSWLIGEDMAGGASRDMYNPSCFANPGKVSDAYYACTTADNGGVHTNSGIPNHAYALTVDGGTYNGQTVAGIGLTKAAHIYFRAQSAYQVATSNFADHADALAQSCADLTGANLNDLSTGAPSGQIITASDCAQVAKAAVAVQMRDDPTAQCGFKPLLAKSPPPQCPSGSPTPLMTDSFDGGKKGGVKWTISATGSQPEFVKRNWAVVSALPGGRSGSALFAADYGGGTCTPGGNQAGLQRLESPEIALPADGRVTRLSFDHWIATEAGYDGGNVKVSVNGGAWKLISAVDFVYNAYNSMNKASDNGNDSPLTGEPFFSGTDAGGFSGSWGRSIVNLAPYAKPGDRIKLRFELGNDGCGGIAGWYLDDVTVYSCTAGN